MTDKLAAMQKAADIGNSLFRRFKYMLEPGLSTEKLDAFAATCIKANKAEPTFKGYGPSGCPFPATICVSVNEEICHGIPSDRTIEGGDLVSIDLGIRYDGFTIDTCRTFEIGEISEEADHLNYWTKTALQRALRNIKAGKCWQDIARIIENTAKAKNLNVIKEMTGHGVGKNLHEEPVLRNFACAANELIILEEGATLAIEPMFSVGSGECEIADNKWTVITKDRALSSHWEHTIVVTESGYDLIL